MKSTRAMRDRIRELATTNDDYDRAVLRALDDFDKIEAAVRRALASNPHNQKQIGAAMDDLAVAIGVTVISERAITSGPYEARLCKDMPTDCCDFGVVSLSEGREVARVWRRDDAQRIADLLNVPV